MPTLTRAQTIECFHLTFTQVLFARLNPRSVAVKGGANLRYFFDSHRYSEGIDFDVVSGEEWKLFDQVDRAIASPTLSLLLRATGISVEQSSPHKQTGATQRWNLLLKAPSLARPVSTKIEFSRRNGDDRWLLDAVPDRVVAPYALRPPTMLHYTAAPATEQKILALAGRSETQSRDVFDLELLIRSHPGAVNRGKIEPGKLRSAIDRCFELPFEAFDAQVIPFLEPDIAEIYRSPAAWEQIQRFVADRLTELLDEGH